LPAVIRSSAWGWFEAVAAAAIGGISFMGERTPGFCGHFGVTIPLLNGLGLMVSYSIQYVFVGLILILGMSMNILIERVVPAGQENRSRGSFGKS
jgi:ribose/xylose/arabinose/galactoside ABC-type transport system permease subunit